MYSWFLELNQFKMGATTDYRKPKNGYKSVDLTYTEL